LSNYTPKEIYKTEYFLLSSIDKGYTCNQNGNMNCHVTFMDSCNYYLTLGNSQSSFSSSYTSFAGKSPVLSYVAAEKFICNLVNAKIGSGASYLWHAFFGAYGGKIPIEINKMSVSSMFKQTEEMSYTSTNTTPLLDYVSAKWAVESTSAISVQLLSGWTYYNEVNSQHALHYVVKAVVGGNNDSAKLIFKCFPYVNSGVPSYLQVSGVSMYSEFIRAYKSSQNIIFDLIPSNFSYGFSAGSYAQYYFGGHALYDKPTSYVSLWTDSRRKDIDNSETDAITMLLKDATHLGVYHHFLPWVPETIAEFTFEQNFKQCTYFYGKYILLGEDMKVYHLMDNGTLVQILDSGIDPSETVMLVSHPDQDLCYLLGGSKQFIIDRDLDYTMVESAWSGLAEGLRYTNFDCRGRVWVGKQCRSKTTLEEIHSIAAGGICNFTYFAGSDSVCYDLDGNALSNIPATFISYVHYSNLIWKYPQAVEVPWGEEDFKRQSNRDVWYGRNTSTGELEPYDETNAIPIELDEADNESCLLSDGVRFVVCDSSGGNILHESDVFYFSVATGIIKDVLSKVEIRFCLDSLDYIKSTNEFTISSATHNVPEFDDDDFIQISNTVFDCTINSLPATIITSGSPTQGQVHVNTNGTLTFNTADIGVIANIEYYVAKDPYVS